MVIDTDFVDSNRPYPPPSNVIAVLERLRSRNLPDIVDGEFLRDAGVPDGTNTRTLFALRFLSLIDRDMPTAALRSIAISTDEEYKQILEGLVRDAYSEVFEVHDPAQDNQAAFVNFFRRYAPASQRPRMVTFFLGMCREAGIAILEPPRKRVSSASIGGPRASKPAARKSSSRKAPALGGSLEIAPALQGLVESLPKQGSVLSKARRDQWIEMARATLAFLYPEQAADADTAPNDQDDHGEGDDSD